MKYFMISQDKELSNLIVPEKLNPSVYKDGVSKKDFDKAPPMIVSYFSNSQELEKPDILYSPAFLVSDRFKKLLKVFNPKMSFKGIRCYPHEMEDSEALLYWWTYIPKVKCLGEETEKDPTGLIKHLVVEEGKLQGKSILVVDGTVENIVLVSLELAESMLRRNFWGMNFIPVEIRR